MAFYHRYFANGDRQRLRRFDYYEWNAVGRKDAAQHITSDTRPQPKAEEPLDLDDEARYHPGARRASWRSPARSCTRPCRTRPASSRFSIDFRTVQPRRRARAAVARRTSTPAPTGTSLRDFRSVASGARFADDEIEPYDEGADRSDAVLVFTPEGTA